MDKNNNFIYGAQYYRNPTPDKREWAADLRNMKQMGLKDVKFWVQWRSNHIGPDKFDYSDIDELMDLALENDLRVTLNVIFDVSPVWLLREYPDCVQVTASGKQVIPTAPGHRQLGGFPGACYNHPHSRGYREKFLKETVKRYAKHPAMYMWDVWNEPEQCGTYRKPEVENITCFCAHCRERFLEWLKCKYNDIQTLKSVWGKCYRSFDDVELPTDVHTLKDFMDYRIFQAEVMTEEAKMRIRTVKGIDKEHQVYLHVVPNTSTIFNAITGVNDFEMAKDCDVFASTNFAAPIWSLLTTSAGRGKLCYNVECHIGSGSISIHQKQITYEQLVRDFAAQIGSGIRGFMFWQYRPEVLGREAPAWGMTKLNGEICSVGKAAEKFGKQVRKIEDHLQKPKEDNAEIAVWKGFENEVFAYASQVSLDSFGKAIKNYVNAIYNNNYSCKIVDDGAIIRGELGNVKLLIMPECYCMSKELYQAVDTYVRNGGAVLCEAHFGGFDSDKGRHSFEMPGCGAADSWGIKEYETTSSYHLKTAQSSEMVKNISLPDDVKKAIDAYGLDGGLFFSIIEEDGKHLTGCNRVAFLETLNGKSLGQTMGHSIIVSSQVGEGKVYYAGTNLGEGAEIDMHNFEQFLLCIFEETEVQPNGGLSKQNFHMDIIDDELITVNNLSDEDITLSGEYVSVFFDESKSENGSIVIPAHRADILQKEK